MCDWVARFDEVLSRHFQRGFDGFGAAGNEVGVSQAAGLVSDQHFGQFFRWGGGEEAGVGVGQGADLALDRLDNALVLVAEATDRRAAGCVEDLAPVGGGEPDAVTGDRDGRRGAAEGAMDDAASCHVFGPVTYWDCAASRTSVSHRRVRADWPPRVKVAPARATEFRGKITSQRENFVSVSSG